VQVGSGINGVSRNLEETGVVFVAWAADGIKFPKRSRDRARDIVRSENVTVPHCFFVFVVMPPQSWHSKYSRYHSNCFFEEKNRRIPGGSEAHKNPTLFLYRPERIVCKKQT